MTEYINSVDDILKAAAARNMPLEQMRFFVGEDCKEPRCFGIFHDASRDTWVVYKNKSDGSRSIRYDGPDEGYAARELWAKIESEIALRAGSGRGVRVSRPRRTNPILIGGALIFLVVMLCTFLFDNGSTSRRRDLQRRGYYLDDDDVYYYQNNSWYLLEEAGWMLLESAMDPDDGIYYGDICPAECADTRFEDSGYYAQDSYSSDYDYDDDYDRDDYDFDFDSWDSSDTDWDSDW